MTLLCLWSLGACDLATRQAREVVDRVEQQTGASGARDRQARSGTLQSAAVLQQGSVAYFYQTVGLQKQGSGRQNATRIGALAEGQVVRTDGIDAAVWDPGGSSSSGYGDPVFSSLPGGRWAMTARSRGEDPPGSGQLLYFEGACPFVDDAEVITLTGSSRRGCEDVERTLRSKTSQIFQADGESWIFQLMDRRLRLTHIGSSGKSTRDLDGICALQSRPRRLSEVGFGEAFEVFASGQDEGLRVSDAAIAQRSDGTWVLFVKGVAEGTGCASGATCELCARSIYRSTSRDLMTWSSLEEVVKQASVPEAVTARDGKVWLSWQDFSAVCEADDELLALQAPIRAAYEQGGGLSPAVSVSFPDEPFEGNPKMHYATNGNPVQLRDAQALASLQACLASGEEPRVSAQPSVARPPASSGEPAAKSGKAGGKAGKSTSTKAGKETPAKRR